MLVGEPAVSTLSGVVLDSRFWIAEGSEAFELPEDEDVARRRSASS